MRQVFSELGAKVSWDPATQGITAVKDTTKIQLTIGSKTAQVNGAKVTLTQAPEIINGTTLVPLRFIGESLGSKVSWDTWKSAAVISSIKTNDLGVKYSVSTVTGYRGASINVMYGKHHYESTSQAQYDKVMEIVHNNLKGYKDTPFYTKNPDYQNSEEIRQGLEDYLTKDIIAPFDENFGDYYLGNRISYTLKDLVNNGVSKQDAIEAYTIWGIAISSMKQNSSPTTDNKEIRSAYDSLVLGKIDCDSWSNAVIAHFDAAGYSTAVIANNVHATPFVKIGDNWYQLNAGIHFEAKVLTIEEGQYWYAAPTF